MKYPTFLAILLLAIYSCQAPSSSSEPPHQSVDTISTRSLIGIDLAYSRGFLVLDNRSNMDIEQWVIETTSPKSEESVKLKKGVNYTKLPKILYSGDVDLSVKGLDDEGNTVVYGTPLSNNDLTAILDQPNPLDRECSWTCRSNSYALEIVKYKDPNSNGYQLVLQQAFDEDNGTFSYFFNWVTEQSFNSYCQSINRPFPCTDGYRRIGPNSAGKYGIAIEMGQWQGSSIATPKNNLIFNYLDCSSSINHPIIMLNNFGDFSNNSTGTPWPKVPVSGCVTQSSGGGGGEPIGSTAACIGTTFNSDDGVWGYLNDYYACLEEEGYSADWDDLFDEPIRIRNLNDLDDEPIVINVDDSFDDKGVYIGSNIRMQESLYLIEIPSNDGKHHYSIQEIDGTKMGEPDKEARRFFNRLMKK